MRMHTLAAALAATLATSAALPAGAQTIYPLDRAEIMAGGRFDFKVEFPGAPAEADVKVTINGQDAAAFFGKPATCTSRMM